MVDEPNTDAMTIEFDSGVLGLHVGGRGRTGQVLVEIAGSEGWALAPTYGPPEVVLGGDADPQILGPAELGVPAPRSAFTEVYDSIADFLDGGPVPPCAGAAGLATQEIAIAGVQSIRQGRGGLCQTARLSQALPVFCAVSSATVRL